MAARARRGVRAVARETWITDPDALLAALSRAEQAEVPQIPEMRSVQSMEPPPAPDVHAEPEGAPALRDDERMAPASRPGTVTVIIRRRRAA
jgi:hypothetical protein